MKHLTIIFGLIILVLGGIVYFQAKQIDKLENVNESEKRESQKRFEMLRLETEKQTKMFADSLEHERILARAYQSETEAAKKAAIDSENRRKKFIFKVLTDEKRDSTLRSLYPSLK